MVLEAIRYDHWGSSPPFQPFLNMHSDSYQEFQMSWNPYCVKKDALLYQFRTGNEDNTIELVPDACLNILLELDMSRPHAILSGTSLRPTQLTLKPNTTYFGFKPYSNLGIKSPGTGFCELINASIDLTCVYPGANRMIEDMLSAETINERIGIFLNFTINNLVDHDYSPTFVDYLAIILCSAHENIVFSSIGTSIGYSERYCRGKFKECFGLSPKQYSSIIRFQNALKALVSGSCGELSSLAAECGYFDQAHLTHEFRRYINTPPDKFLRNFQDNAAKNVECVCEAPHGSLYHLLRSWYVNNNDKEKS